MSIPVERDVISTSSSGCSSILLYSEMIDSAFGDIGTIDISRTLVFGAINFFILSVIFVYTYMRKIGYTSIKDALLKGIGFALIATGLFMIVDILSGGIAIMMMFLLYPLIGITMIVLSLISPVFLRDISENEDGEKTQISLFQLWSVSFWSIFLIGMLISLGLGALISYIGSRVSKIAMEMITTIASMNIINI